MKNLKVFDKYRYYSQSVQSPTDDVKFLSSLYRRLRGGRKARILREDFCGTFANLCEWVKLDRRNHGVGIDLDRNPLDYGRKNYLSRLGAASKRIHLHMANVLHARVELSDLIVALNFSYFTFKKREDLVTYFRNCRHGLKAKGLLVVDCFGGTQCYEKNVDKTRKRGFFYIWEQKFFNPITNESKFAIHFKRDGERMRKNVFRYDWRMWTIAEISEALIEAGFAKTSVYWEQGDGRGGGNGVFRRSTKGEECASWVAYIVGFP